MFNPFNELAEELRNAPAGIEQIPTDLLWNPCKVSSAQATILSVSRTRARSATGLLHDKLGRHRRRRWTRGLEAPVAIARRSRGRGRVFSRNVRCRGKVSGRQNVECWPALLCSLATSRAMDRLRKRYRHGNRFTSDSGHGRATLTWRRPPRPTPARPSMRSPPNCPSGCARRWRNFLKNKPKRFICTRSAAGAIASSASDCG